MKFLDDIMDIVGGQDVTYVCFVCDHSGSMKMSLENGKTKADAAQENFNEYIATLKKESESDMETLVTIVEFDDTIKCTDRHKLIKEVSPMTSYWTGGMTALYDAIAMGINTISKSMDRDDRKNKAALVIIQTDGAENFSSDYSGREGQKRLQKMISELEESGLWTFVFLGENIDKNLAYDIGMTPNNFMKTEATGQSYTTTNYAVNAGLSNYYNSRKVGFTQSKSFFKAEEENVNNT